MFVSEGGLGVLSTCLSPPSDSGQDVSGKQWSDGKQINSSTLPLRVLYFSGEGPKKKGKSKKKKGE